MDAFNRELVRRSPLAAAVLETCDFLFDDAWLAEVYETHRGRCYEDKLSFGQFLKLTRDALLRHEGSAHRLFVELEADNSHPIDESNFYRKLSRTPPALSRALLRDSAARLSSLMPTAQTTLPKCFDGFELIAGDGKTMKQVAARLKPTRPYTASLLGGKALVALDLRSGLAIAMSDTLDGMANDVPLAPALLGQVRALIAAPVLSLWDRQFDDFATYTHLQGRAGDSFVTRVRKGGLNFTAESRVESVDDEGRKIVDEIGTFVRSGRKPGAGPLRLRRATLIRGDGEEDVILMTDLADRGKFTAADLLELYRHRWRIEQVFQQVTQTFSLSHLIGCGPKATLFQLAYCLLLYNLTQVVKAYLAADGGVLPSIVSTFYLFQDMRKELEAWAYHGDGDWPRHSRDAVAMRTRLAELLKGRWNARRYTKASDKRPRGKPKPRQRLKGDHVSVQRVLQGRVELYGK
jgi:hypothetical protein